MLRVVAGLNRWATRHTSLELPAAQARTLALVEDLAPARVTALAAADGCSQPTMTEQIKRLERAGLVERGPDPTDARASLLRPSTQGRALLARTRQARAAALRPLLDDLAAPREALRHALGVLTELLERAHAADG